ncbi:rRNA-processing protein cgr1 [Ciborinia camelliae]|nr:rRNA-processing protein cgr1 [Ciborinia camelliae]
MSTEMAPTVVAPASTVATSAVIPQGMRKNGTYALAQIDAFRSAARYKVADLIFLGKQWHPVKKAFRPKAGNTSYEKRKANDEAVAATKAKEKEMKEEKEAARQAHITKIKEKRANKEERERYEKMAETMHQKRVDRLKRREKRNKMLKS